MEFTLEHSALTVCISKIKFQNLLTPEQIDTRKNTQSENDDDNFEVDFFFQKFLLFSNLENVYLALYLEIIQIEFATEKSVQPCWKCYCDDDDGNGDKFFFVLCKYHKEFFWVSLFEYIVTRILKKKDLIASQISWFAKAKHMFWKFVFILQFNRNSF